MNFLDSLNSSQRDAVTCTEGPSLIVAGAGSGKTRVLTYRIAYLLQQGVPANRIMALTFTNKAAREMKERVRNLLSTFNFPLSTFNYLMMGTFHSVCTRLIRPHADRISYTRDFTIYDTPDMKSVIKSVCKERGLDEKIYKASAVQARISMLKNCGISPEAYGMNQQLLREDREMRMYEFATVYALYQARLHAANAMDFDDLLINMLRLMDACPDVRDRFQQQFQYILVDEYQDTNYIQFLLVKQLAAPQNNICVVGDDAQSIYSFRGADIRNILNFRQIYPSAHLFKLEQNYRSTQTIVNAANSLIHKNIHQIEKTVWSEKEQGQPLTLRPYMDDRTEALGVATKIKQLKSKTSASSHSPSASSHYGYDAFAVLYRTNAQSRVIENELRKLNIPYRIYGGTSFYQRKEIKDALGYLRLAVNPRDNEALLRIVGFPGRGIGETTMKKVAANAIEHHRCYLDVMRSPDETGLDVGAAVRKKLQSFAAYMDGLGEQSETMDAFAFTEMVLRTSGVTTALALDRSAEGIDRAQNVQELLNAIHEFVGQRAAEGIDYTPITDFLSEVSLLTDQDENIADTTERVTLMTVHAAKGLEFPVVFIVGLEENLFPSQFAVKPAEIEEERRLLYVAVTRAMEQCHLSFARQRFRNGSFSFASPSRFLNDIDRQYFVLDRPAQPGTPSIPRIPSSPSPSFVNQSVSERSERSKVNLDSGLSAKRSVSGATAVSSAWKSGDRVSHRVFGLGTVVRVYRDEVTENDKIEIHFDTQGTKTLLLTHAKLDRA